MSIKISIDQLNGTAVATGGTADTAAGERLGKIHSWYAVSARGVLTADEDGKVTFVSDDSDEFDAVIAADEA